jgi:hypothetical protein
MKARKIIGKACSVAVLLLPVGCATTFHDFPPNTTSTPAPQPTLSTVFVPISIPLATLQDAAERQMQPRTVEVARYNESINGGADKPKGISLGYAITRSISLSGTGTNALNTNIHLEYWMAGRRRLLEDGSGPLINFSCGTNGEPGRVADIGLSTTLTIKPDWDVDARTSVGRVSAGNRCLVTVFNIDLTDKILDFLRGRVQKAAEALDQRIESDAHLKDRVTAAWQTLSQPIAIGQDTWLTIDPRALVVTPIKVDSSVRITVGLKAYPRVVLGQKPAVDSKPLPDAEMDVPSDAFSVFLPVDLQYAAVSQQVRKLLKIDEGGIRYPPVGNNYLKAADAEVFGYGRSAVIRIRFDGSAKGYLYLTGKPTYDAVTDVLTFPDLDFTIESKNLLLKQIDWLKHEDIRDDLRSRLKLDLASSVKQVRANIHKWLNQPIGNLQLQGNLSDLRLLGVHSDAAQGRFVVYLTLNGTLAATVK